MKRFLLLILALSLILCGCGQPEPTEPPTSAPTMPTEPPTEAPTAPPAEPPTSVPAEPPITHPLTGEVVEEEVTARPYGIMINNAQAALPHHGISNADIVYETLVEGHMTRFMAIFTQATADPIGSVRSCRPPFVDIIQAYDGIYSSASGDTAVLRQIADSGVTYLNGLLYVGDYFYRDSWRRGNGYALEHTLFVTGEDLIRLANDQGISTTAEAGMDYGLNFAADAAVDGETANTIEITFDDYVKTTTATYSADLGGYWLTQYGQQYNDGNTGEPVVFRNVLILQAQKSYMPNNVHVQMQTVGQGAGYYALDGKLIPITWSRESEDAPFIYKTADGTELTLGTGTTYIAIVRDTCPAIYS